VILAIGDRYLFTVEELKEEVSHHQPGTRIQVRYRRRSAMDEASVVVGRAE
jgi:S1-C subfamily serine protease